MLRPLSYDEVISLHEAEERYREVESVYRQIEGRYSGFARFRRNLREDDRKELGDCFGILLPLSTQGAVQKQVIKVKTPDEFRDSLFGRCGSLCEKIWVFAARFKNTGVRVYFTSEPIT